VSTWPFLVAFVVVGIAGPALSDGWQDKSGQGLWWRGEWKEEFWDGPCQVKREAKRDEY
jgi:hypothetical protein